MEKISLDSFLFSDGFVKQSSTQVNQDNQVESYSKNDIF